MARQIWCVFVDTNQTIEETGAFRGHYKIAHEADTSKFGLFFNPELARQFAKHVASQNPGQEVYVLKQDFGLYNAVSPKIIEKRWNENGEYTPI